MSVENARAALIAAYLEAMDTPLPGAVFVGYKLTYEGFEALLLPVEGQSNFFTTTGDVAPDPLEHGWASLHWISLGGEDYAWELQVFPPGAFGPSNLTGLGATADTPEDASWGNEDVALTKEFQKQDVVTAYDNVDFTPPASGKAWNRVHFAPNVPVPVTLGAAGEDEFTGFLQVTCCCSAGKGESKALEQVQLLLSKFKTGSKFSYSGQEVTILKAGRSPGFSSNEWYKIPVTIFFIARHPRNTPT